MLALTLAGCGVRGSLDLPPEAKAQREADKRAADAAKKSGTPAAPRPHEPFILDGLLR